jgi:glucose-1-phosphate thymidylyltransferase
VEAGQRGIVRTPNAVAAALLHCSPTHDGPDDRLLQALLAGAAASDPTAALQDPTEALKAHDLVELDAMVDMLEWPHEAVSFHELALAGSLAIRLDSGAYREIRPGLFVAPEAHVAAEVVVRQGPVVVEAGAEIGPFVCLDGPLWIGPQTKVNPHAWLRAGSAIGAHCRVGGEIEASVMEPYSNKAHDGFLGHSHVGSWVNIAAGTITSNLKVSYGPIRLPARPGHPTDRLETGRQFLGALIGDMAKTGINSSIPCGATIGVAATVTGNVPTCVEAFTTTLVDDGGLPRRTTPAQAATGLERMMARRGVELLPADRNLLEFLAEKA